MTRIAATRKDAQIIADLWNDVRLTIDSIWPGGAGAAKTQDSVLKEMGNPLTFFYITDANDAFAMVYYPESVKDSQMLIWVTSPGMDKDATRTAFLRVVKAWYDDAVKRGVTGKLWGDYPSNRLSTFSSRFSDSPTADRGKLFHEREARLKQSPDREGFTRFETDIQSLENVASWPEG